jgi:hypothetical protein
VDQVANLIDEVAPEDLNLFNEILEGHIFCYDDCQP